MNKKLIYILYLIIISSLFVAFGCKKRENIYKADKENRIVLNLDKDMNYYIDYEMLRNKFLEKDYDSLIELFEEYDKEFEMDNRYEEKYIYTFEVFAIEDENYENYFNEWIKKSPENSIPYIARIKYYLTLALMIISEEKQENNGQEQFKGFMYYLEKAEKDIEKAIELDKDNIALAELRLIKNMGENKSYENRVIINEITEKYPNLYYLRKTYLYTVEPKWGGSREDITSYIDSTLEYKDINFKFEILKGYLDKVYGDINTYSSKNEEALKYYNNALDFGDDPLYYNRRAKIYMTLGDNESALNDINKAIELLPYQKDYYMTKVRIDFLLGNYSEIERDLKELQRISPYSKDLLHLKQNLSHMFEKNGVSNFTEKNYEKALEDYKMALKIYPRAEIYNRISRVYIMNKDSQKAKEYIIKSIDMDGDYFDSYKILDWLYYEDRDWETIIKYWTKYIDRNPKDSNAYLERGGAYYHSKDYEKALQDVKMSSKLGNLEGTKRYNQLKEMLEENNLDNLTEE